MKGLSILIVDDHDVVRRGIRALLEERPDWTVCGEAATGREAIAKVEELPPDLVLLDLAMPDVEGLAAIPRIRAISPKTRILVLTMHDSGDRAAQALAAGASGLLLKSDAGRDLVTAVKAIENDQPFLSPSVTKLIMRHLEKTAPTGPSPEDVTPRELEVLKLLALGRTHKEVASALDISAKTVDAHRAAIMRKLHLATYSDLILFAIRHKIVKI